MNMDKKNQRELRIAFRKGYMVPENTGAYWTDDTREQLAYRYSEVGVGLTELAEEFGRSESAIVQQLIAMGLFTPPTFTRPRLPRKPKCLCSKCRCKKCIRDRKGKT